MPPSRPIPPAGVWKPTPGEMPRRPPGILVGATLCAFMERLRCVALGCVWWALPRKRFLPSICTSPFPPPAQMGMSRSEDIHRPHFTNGKEIATEGQEPRVSCLWYFSSWRGADIWRCLPCCFGSCPFYLILGRIKRPLYLECKIQFWKPKIKVSTGLLFLKPSRKSLFPCLFQFLEATYISWLWPIAHITPSSCLSHCIY